MVKLARLNFVLPLLYMKLFLEPFSTYNISSLKIIAVIKKYRSIVLKMGLCFVPGCDHQHPSACKMFKMPTDPKVRKLWMKNLACRVDRKPTTTTVVCSCHFKDGKKENGPTIFSHNIKKVFQFHSPEKKPRTVRKSIEVPSTLKHVHVETDPDTVTSLDPGLEEEDSLQVQILKKKISNFEVQLQKVKTKFSYTQIKDSDELVHLYTGLPNQHVFLALVNYIKTVKIKYYLGWTVVHIEMEDQLLITLMKLRLNVPHLDIATRFGCGRATISKIFLTILHVLHSLLFKKFMNNIPSQRKTVTCLPNAFSSFTNCRIIIDCTEIRIAVPKNMKEQKESYSSYKHMNTYKALVGVAPNGVIVFVSNLYPGSTSDRQIFANCGLKEQLQTGDMVMADKGFLISDLVPPGVHVNIPPFLLNHQFSEEQSKRILNIARARVHVERANARIKRYTILNFIPASLKQYSSIVFQVCSSLKVD